MRMELMETGIGFCCVRHRQHCLVPASLCLSTLILSVSGHPSLQSSVSLSIVCLGQMKMYKKGPLHHLKNGNEAAHLVRFLWMLSDTRYTNNLAEILACSKHNKILRHSCIVLPWIHLVLLSALSLAGCMTASARMCNDLLYNTLQLLDWVFLEEGNCVLLTFLPSASNVNVSA